MVLLRAGLGVLLLATVAPAQIGTPPACSDAVTDRERFQAHHDRIRFHLRFRTAAGVFDARSLIRVPPRGASDPAWTQGQAVDFMIDELVKEPRTFLAP